MVGSASLVRQEPTDRGGAPKQQTPLQYQFELFPYRRPRSVVCERKDGEPGPSIADVLRASVGQISPDGVLSTVHERTTAAQRAQSGQRSLNRRVAKDSNAPVALKGQTTHARRGAANANESRHTDVIWSPTTDDERLAGLAGFMTGDGSIAARHSRYRRKDGSVSFYGPTYTGAFYSNIKSDLEDILSDCLTIGITNKATVTLKKNISGRANGFQLQISKRACETLIAAGVPFGKKVRKEFAVPCWIANGTPGVKRAFISALFGAEGTMPVKDRFAQSRFPRQPLLTMCKEGAVTGEGYFSQLRHLLIDLGVRATVTKTTRANGSYHTYCLRISSGPENLIRFFEDVGYLYCRQKSVCGLRWADYLRAYQERSASRRLLALNGRAAGDTYKIIGKRLGITAGAVHRLLSSIDAGASTTAGHSFEHFAEWLLRTQSQIGSIADAHTVIL